MLILHQGLQLFPYKIKILQLQCDANKAERRGFRQNISQGIEVHPDFLDFIFFSDEANFHLKSCKKTSYALLDSGSAS